MCTKGTVHKGEGEVSSNRSHHRGGGSELKTKGLPSPLGPRGVGVGGGAGAQKKSGFQNPETTQLCEEPPCGHRTFRWCLSRWVRDICGEESWGAPSSSHLSPPFETPSLAKLKGRSQRERSEAVSITQPLGRGGRPIYLGGEKII